MRRLPLAVAVASLLALAGCGDTKPKAPITQVPSTERPAVKAAQNPDLSSFPAAKGKSLQGIISELGAQVGGANLGTSDFTTGTTRIAFGSIDEQSNFIYGPSVIYVQPKQGHKAATGPFAAPADVLLTQAKFRSKQALTEGSPLAAIYAGQVPFPKAGTYQAITVTRATDGKVIAGAAEFKVVRKAADPIPGVGEKMPRLQTDTIGTVKGLTDLLDTREPPSDMHAVSLADVVGSKPVALIIATPQLCTSRVCGPVVDEALQMRSTYGDRMTFIHQEVFRDNNPNKGYRAPLQALHLQTEPWLFVVGRDGRITARLEGSFGVHAFEAAVKTGL